MSDRPTGRPPPQLKAVLGPTNTGKTHLAVERMLGHESGMIGLPLRLLAREVYDRIAKARGARSVALITGEEKIVPPRAQYFVCTVEAMPLNREVEFLAVQRHGLHGADEILGPGRDDLLLAGDQRHRAGPPRLGDAVVDLPRQQPQRQADHPRGMAQHALDGEVGLARIGGPEHGLQLGRRAPGRTVAHARKVGDSGPPDKRGMEATAHGACALDVGPVRGDRNARSEVGGAYGKGKGQATRP